MAKRGIITIPKSLRDTYDMQPGDTFTLLDLGGVLVLTPGQSEIDALASKIAARWTEDGETLEAILAALEEERDRHGG
jgi:AbrB family looped-hinge helix DNA binding protein